MSETMRMFDVAAGAVVEGAGCTWCGASVGEQCHRVRSDGISWWPEHTHSSRWRDYWNATHDREYRVRVDPAPDMRNRPA